MSSLTNDASSVVNPGEVGVPAQRALGQVILRWTMRLLVAGVFITAAAYKITDPAAFAIVIQRYQILPDSIIQPLAIALPWLEVVCALAMLSASKWRCAGGLMIAVLLLVFMAAAGSAWWRGLNVACGCFTASTEASPIGPWLFTRNMLLIIAVGVGTWSDWVAVFKGSLRA